MVLDVICNSELKQDNKSKEDINFYIKDYFKRVIGYPEN